MVSPRAWFVLATIAIAALLYVGTGLRRERQFSGPAASAGTLYAQEANKHALVWNEVPSFGILPGSAMYRTKITGGWLVFGVIPSARNSEPVASGLTFVPDPDHKWDGTSLK